MIMVIPGHGQSEPERPRRRAAESGGASDQLAAAPRAIRVIRNLNSSESD
jgi:hypothetical protein